MSVIRISAILMLCLAATACGRKGPLEPPPGSQPTSLTQELGATR